MSIIVAADLERREDASAAAPGADFERQAWALALSGGGYKAAAYHLGALARIAETGGLKKLKRISSVSGGTIIAAYLATRWKDLTWRGDVASNFTDLIVRPFSQFLHRVTIDRWAILEGLALPGRAGADAVRDAYAKHLFGDRTLQDLPPRASAPRFVINATNMRLNSLWRFSNDYAADYRVGEIKAPKFDLARIVTASSAFPPFFCPVDLDLSKTPPVAYDSSDRCVAPFNRVAELGDGGIYDNMGLETVWKRYGVLLISNAGDPIDEESKLPKDWLGILRRALSMIHRQAENNRVSELMLRQASGEYDLAYFPLRRLAKPFPKPSAHALSDSEAALAAKEKVRLRAMPAVNLNRLVRHGYARADAAMRSYLGVTDPAPGPPDTGV